MQGHLNVKFTQSEESDNIDQIFLPQQAVYRKTNKKERHSYQDEHIWTTTIIHNHNEAGRETVGSYQYNAILSITFICQQNDFTMLILFCQ